MRTSSHGTRTPKGDRRNESQREVLSVGDNRALIQKRVEGQIGGSVRMAANREVITSLGIGMNNEVLENGVLGKL